MKRVEKLKRPASRQPAAADCIATAHRQRVDLTSACSHGHRDASAATNGCAKTSKAATNTATSAARTTGRTRVCVCGRGRQSASSGCTCSCDAFSCRHICNIADSIYRCVSCSRRRRRCRHRCSSPRRLDLHAAAVVRCPAPSFLSVCHQRWSRVGRDSPIHPLPLPAGPCR